MISKKIVISLIISIIISVSMIGYVNATSNSFDFTVNPAQVTAKLGDIVTVELGIADIDQETNGIHAVQGDLSYDEDLFESVEIVSAGNNWTVSLNQEENNNLRGRFIINNMNGVKESSVVAVLKARIKSEATVTTGQINFKDVCSSYGTTETAKISKTITVKIETEQKDEKDPIVPDNNKVDNNTGSTTQNKPTSNQGTVSQTSNKTPTASNATNLPKAGLSRWIVIAIVVSIIGTIAGYIKYKKTY